uniref:Uncharacterized protein n=1 Tax=Geospiza parvula TaxID=87175 RepID=A0A8C3MVK9_GEOPR
MIQTGRLRIPSPAPWQGHQDLPACTQQEPLPALGLTDALTQGISLLSQRCPFLSTPKPTVTIHTLTTSAIPELNNSALLLPTCPHLLPAV